LRVEAYLITQNTKRVFLQEFSFDGLHKWWFDSYFRL